MTNRIVIALFIVLILISASLGNWTDLREPANRQVLVREAGRVVKVAFVVASALTRAAIDSVCALAESMASREVGCSGERRDWPNG